MVSHRIYVLVTLVGLPPKENEPDVSPGVTQNCGLFVRTQPGHGWKHWIVFTTREHGWRLYSTEIRLHGGFQFMRKVRVGTVKDGKLDDYLRMFDEMPIPDGDERWNSKLWINNVLEECQRRDFMKKIRNISDILNDINRVGVEAT